MGLRPHDGARGSASAAVLSVVLPIVVAGCGAPTFSGSGAPFRCASDGRCPEGYSCLSELCVRSGDPRPPPIVHRSAGVFFPQVYPYPDGQGVMGCWSTDEDRDSAGATVWGGFVGADGVTRSSVPLATFDSRGHDFLTSCAPVPNSGGRVLVAIWLQRSGHSEMRLMVWTPANAGSPDGGTTTMLYSETSPADVTSTLEPNFFEFDVVGNEVWVLWDLSLGPPEISPMEAPLHSGIRFRVSAADLAAGMPRRDVMIPSVRSYQGYSVRLRSGPAGDGAWVVMGSGFVQFGYFGPMGGALNYTLGAFPGTTFTNLSLASNTVMSSAGAPAQQLAALLADPLDPVGLSVYHRLAWITERTRQPAYGPRLPFRRTSTIRPGAFRRGDDLFVLGSPVGQPVPTVPVDGGVTSADGGPVGDATVADGGTTEIPFVLYRIPWGSPDTAEPVMVRRLEPRAASAQVIAAGAALMPGTMERAMGTIWVEFYPNDGANHGARYVAYGARFDLP